MGGVCSPGQSGGRDRVEGVSLQVCVYLFKGERREERRENTMGAAGKRRGRERKGC